MATEIHYANVGLKSIDLNTGEVYNRGQGGRTIKECLNFTTEHRVLEDADIPNSSGFPTVKDYLEAEGGDGFGLIHMDQYTIVTQKTT